MPGAKEAKSGQGADARSSRTHEGEAPQPRASRAENPFTTAKGKNFFLLEPCWKTTPFPRETREKKAPNRAGQARFGAFVASSEQRAARRMHTIYFFDSSFEIRSE